MREREMAPRAPQHAPSTHARVDRDQDAAREGVDDVAAVPRLQQVQQRPLVHVVHGRDVVRVVQMARVARVRRRQLHRERLPARPVFQLQRFTQRIAHIPQRPRLRGVAEPHGLGHCWGAGVFVGGRAGVSRGRVEVYPCIVGRGLKSAAGHHTRVNINVYMRVLVVMLVCPRLHEA